jgi:hypothetical protein
MVGGLVPTTKKPSENLQERFKREWLELDARSEPLGAYRDLVRDWIIKLEAIKGDRTYFNHWCVKEAPIYSMNKGNGITAKLFRSSRKNGALCWIRTGRRTTDFCLLSMDLNLKIEKSQNRFDNPQKATAINPDALGIRRNGRFTVFEVKGPQDERTYHDPLLQAVCGALAVFSKSGMIERLARTTRKERPAYLPANINPRMAGLGINIVMSKTDKDGNDRLPPWTGRESKLCRRILAASPQIEYIACSIVEFREDDEYSSLPLQYLYTRSELWRHRRTRPPFYFSGR